MDDQEFDLIRFNLLSCEKNSERLVDFLCVLINIGIAGVFRNPTRKGSSGTQTPPTLIYSNSRTRASAMEEI